ncbi:MAG: hypothetical protein FJW68_07360 [Actinobacteria bacterium]|nr:hypothetical protein [Actinomycetota bacterium]
MLNTKDKKAITNEVGTRHIRANKKDKGKILDEFCATTSYNRKYAARILRNSPGKVLGYSRIGGRKVKYVITKAKKIKRTRNRIYTYDVFLALKKIWTIFDFICSKRLKPFMAEAIEILTKHKEIDMSPEVKQKLLKIFITSRVIVYAHSATYGFNVYCSKRIYPGDGQSMENISRYIIRTSF